MHGYRHASRRVRRGLSLVELMVVVGVIGGLVAMLLPAVQGARESARRTGCLNNLRQLAVATANYESARGRLPAGALSAEYAAAPWTPHNYYRWSALAHVLPYMENTAVHGAIDMNVPLFRVDFQVAPENRRVVASRIPEFLCPTDGGAAEHASFGPTNYAASAGTGAGGGTPFDADGLFYINSATRVSAITDGLSRTVAFSESILGRTPPPLTPRDEADPNFVYGFARAVPLNQESCEGTALWNFTQPRGFSWANGEYRSALYNHHGLPNSPEFDCISARISGDISEVHAAYGWRAARSWHAGGVNIAMADGSSRFMMDEVDPATWRALATRAGQELARE